MHSLWDIFNLTVPLVVNDLLNSVASMTGSLGNNAMRLLWEQGEGT